MNFIDTPPEEIRNDLTKLQIVLVPKIGYKFLSVIMYVSVHLVRT